MSKSERKIAIEIDEDLKELMPEYIESITKDLKSVAGLLLKNDMEEIRIIGHGLKGSGGGYGIELVTEAGGSIEDAAREGNRRVIEAKTELLISYLEKIEITYVEI